MQGQRRTGMPIFSVTNLESKEPEKFDLPESVNAEWVRAASQEVVDRLFHLTDKGSS